MAGETTNQNGSQGGEGSQNGNQGGDDKNKNAGTEGQNGNEGNGDGKNDMVPHQKFHSEMMRRKEAEQKLQELQSQEAERQRKADEEKGEFKKLYEAEQAKAKDLSTQLEGLTKTVSDFETKAKGRIEESLKSIKADADRTMVQDILKGKSLADQENLLPALLKKFGSPENINAGGRGGNRGDQNDREAQLEEAKKKGDTLTMIKHAPRVQK